MLVFYKMVYGWMGRKTKVTCKTTSHYSVDKQGYWNNRKVSTLIVLISTESLRDVIVNVVITTSRVDSSPSHT